MWVGRESLGENLCNINCQNIYVQNNLKQKSYIEIKCNLRETGYNNTTWISPKNLQIELEFSVI